VLVDLHLLELELELQVQVLLMLQVLDLLLELQGLQELHYLGQEQELRGQTLRQEQEQELQGLDYLRLYLRQEHQELEQELRWELYLYLY
jgi:hypothetical protein